MSKLKGPVLIFVVAAILMIAWFIGKRILFERRQINTSDAKQELTTIKIAGDGYLGYWFLNSPKMKALAPKKGFKIDFKDDGGAYADRLLNFNKQNYDCIILPVNSYIEHGLKYKYPGVIVAGISESKGADAIVGFPDIMPTGKVNDLNSDEIKIVYTSQSPSSFLLDLVITDFDLDNLQNNNNWRVEVGSSEEVLKQAQKAVKNRQIGDAFVMWEPEVSAAMEKLGLQEIWGSDKFQGYIVDVFVFQRDIVANDPKLIEDFLTTYFRVIDYYGMNQDEMFDEMSKSTNLNKEVVKKMVEKIDWLTLNENLTQEFGISSGENDYVQDKIINTIIACSNVLERTQKLNLSELDPYKIINSAMLRSLAENGIKTVGGDTNKVIEFAALSDNEWSGLRELATMRVEPITFQSGNNELDYNGEALVDKVAQTLINNYPSYRVIVRGHTGPGDEEANKKLSLSRATTVKSRLVSNNNISPNRLKVESVGNSKPPKRKSGESEKAYRLRMARVEFILLEGNPL